VRVAIEHGVGLPCGASHVVEEPEEGENLQHSQQDPHVTQSDCHVVEDHATDESPTQECHIEGQEPREELPGLLGLPVLPQQQ
jgi:hypothetical protein